MIGVSISVIASQGSDGGGYIEGFLSGELPALTKLKWMETGLPAGMIGIGASNEFQYLTPPQSFGGFDNDVYQVNLTTGAVRQLAGEYMEDYEADLGKVTRALPLPGDDVVLFGWFGIARFVGGHMVWRIKLTGLGPDGLMVFDAAAKSGNTITAVCKPWADSTTQYRILEIPLNGTSYTAEPSDWPALLVDWDAIYESEIGAEPHPAVILAYAAPNLEYGTAAQQMIGSDGWFTDGTVAVTSAYEVDGKPSCTFYSGWFSSYDGVNYGQIALTTESIRVVGGAIVESTVSEIPIDISFEDVAIPPLSPGYHHWYIGGRGGTSIDLVFGQPAGPSVFWGNLRAAIEIA